MLIEVLGFKIEFLDSELERFYDFLIPKLHFLWANSGWTAAWYVIQFSNLVSILSGFCGKKKEGQISRNLLRIRPDILYFLKSRDQGD